jgi:hypothetical protein
MDEIAHKGDKKNAKQMPTWLLPLVTFLAGALLIFGVRFINYKSDAVHYHANFSLYINGQHDKFDNATFYEEVQVCSLHDENNVRTRTHMHDEHPDLVHVHAHGVTWQQFFANLGYTLSNNLISNDNGVYVDGKDGNTLTFWLNGKATRSIANEVIHGRDVLLINYGKDDDATLQKRYDAIPRDAKEADTHKDPSSCSGSTDVTLTDRLRAGLGLSPAHH